MVTRRLLITTFSVALAAFAYSAALAEEPIKIGLFAPLTGPSAQAGQALRNGVAMAISEINDKGGLLGRQLALIEYDDRSSPEQAVRSATKLIQIDHVAAIVGSLHSGNILAAGPVVEAAKIPLVGAGTSPTWLQKGYAYFFRSLGNAELSVGQLAKYATDHKLARVAIFHSNDEYGNTGANDFAKVAKAGGLEVARNEAFTHGDRDFTGQIGNIVNVAPDAVFVWALGDDLGPVTKQLRQLGYAGPILGAEGYTLPEAVAIAGSAADGVVFASQYLVPKAAADAQDPLMRGFLERYEKKYGSMPASDNAFRGYDALSIIAQGIAKANSIDGTAVRDAIASISGMTGLAGAFDFVGNHGEGIHSVRLYLIKNGAPTEVE
jgi:branched-chain amino acid transport system substrate-binding protein